MLRPNPRPPVCHHVRSIEGSKDGAPDFSGLRKDCKTCAAIEKWLQEIWHQFRCKGSYDSSVEVIESGSPDYRERMHKAISENRVFRVVAPDGGATMTCGPLVDPDDYCPGCHECGA